MANEKKEKRWRRASCCSNSIEFERCFSLLFCHCHCQRDSSYPVYAIYVCIALHIVRQFFGNDFFRFFLFLALNLISFLDGQIEANHLMHEMTVEIEFEMLKSRLCSQIQYIFQCLNTRFVGVRRHRLICMICEKRVEKKIGKKMFKYGFMKKICCLTVDSHRRPIQAYRDAKNLREKKRKL